MTEKLSKGKHVLLTKIQETHETSGRMPTIRQLSTDLKVPLSTIQSRKAALIKDGYLTSNGSPRGLEVVKPAPVLGKLED